MVGEEGDLLSINSGTYLVARRGAKALRMSSRRENCILCCTQRIYFRPPFINASAMGLLDEGCGFFFFFGCGPP